MTIDLEKNDVDLAKLFTWSKEVSIKDANGQLITKVFLRTVGDAEINRARVLALRESSRFRKALRTPGTEEYDAFISELVAQDKETLVKSIVLLTMRDTIDKARLEVDLKFPVEPPSNASSEEQEKHQEEIDTFPDKFNIEVEKITRKKIKVQEKELGQLTEEQLKKNYTNEVISYMCQEAMSQRFIDMCVYFGTYKDKRLKKRSFENFEEYDNSPKELKELLREAYMSIEVRVPDLKKSLEATP